MARYLGPKAKFATIVKARRGVHCDTAGINLVLKTLDYICIFGTNPKSDEKEKYVIHSWGIDEKKVLSEMKEWLKHKRNKPFYIHCAGGYRSMIASSILKARGIENFIDINGGFGAIQKAGIKTTDFVCPSTLKK